MKYCVLIMDGAAGLPSPGRAQTCLELARTPNLDRLTREGKLGLARTVPTGMEPSSACACMSVLGYDPTVYYRGRAGIEARSMGIPVLPGEVVFRCNLVATRDGKMWDYSAGHISDEEARRLIAALNEQLGGEGITFYPGVSYRHILKLAGREDTLGATCTPPHDIPGESIKAFLPHGPGSAFLLELMRRSEAVLADHPVNAERRRRGEVPATTIWLFWGNAAIPDMPAFSQAYGLNAAMTSGVDLLRGLARMMSMDILSIPGITDGPDNDNQAQVSGALDALRDHDLVVIHVEAPDEAGHAGSEKMKIEAIESIDAEIVGRLIAPHADGLRVLVMPDHPTPVSTRTHNADPVPFVFWGPGFAPNGAGRFTEAEARKTGLMIDPACNIMKGFIAGM